MMPRKYQTEKDTGQGIGLLARNGVEAAQTGLAAAGVIAVVNGLLEGRPGGLFIVLFLIAAVLGVMTYRQRSATTRK